MPGILDILGGNPFQEIASKALDIIGRFVPDPQAKAQASLELTKLQADYNLKLAELDAQWATVQGQVITAEANSQSWIARNWRPILMLSFGAIIVYGFFLAPLFSLKSVPLPPDMWQLLKLGIGGYVLGRSGEKIAAVAADAWTTTKSAQITTKP